jgi:Prophage CP4-57 regulatory protein (AlpA)
MPVATAPTKSFLTVSEMAEACRLSRSRFYDLMEAGVFPKPVRHPSSKRPMYDPHLKERCLEIRQTGIDCNGQPVLFNRKPRTASGSPKPAKPTQERGRDHADLLDALKGLGLSSTSQAVESAVAVLFPDGDSAMDQSDLVRRLFLHLQGRKT